MKNGKLIILLSVFYFLQTPSFSAQNSETAKPREVVVIGRIMILGNKVTKNKIILRELPFHENDTVGREEVPQKLRSAKENLLNSSLFNFVSVDTIPVEAGHFDILISVA